MKIRNVFFSRRKWLKVSGIASMGGLFSGIIIPQQCNRIKDSNKPSPYSTKPPLRKSARVSLVKGEDHYQIVYQSLKNIENEIAESIGDKTILIKPNMVVENSPSCATDPIAVKAILDFLKPHHNKQIIIGESTAAFPTDKKPDATTLNLFKAYGYSYQ